MDHAVAQLIARLLICQPWDFESAAARLITGLGPIGRLAKWPRRLVEFLLLSHPDCQRLPNESTLIGILKSDPEIQRLTRRSRRSLSRWARRFDTSTLPPPQMSPAAAATDWEVPAVCTSGELSELLEVPLNRLLWLADRRMSEYQQRKEKLRNYRYFRLSKRSGGSRLIEAPKSDLKRIQRSIANQILRPVPIHSSVHGFVQGRSPVTSAQVHVGQQMILRIDLCDFFPSITSRRVAGLFRTIGYPNQVTSLLTGLCTNRTWRGAVEPGTDPCEQLFDSHLPQGSPASPNLANACAWSLDCRLSGLAARFGVRYTRYADDLIFSGGKEFEFRLSRFRILALAIINHEGFSIRACKTQAMRSDTQQFVTGVVVNERTNVKRADFDRMKAILTNCLRHGMESQNRSQHADFGACLRGQIAWMQAVNPNRGARLLALWEKVLNAEQLRQDSKGAAS